MANCQLNSNLLRNTQCGYALGEIARLFLANFDDVASVTLSGDRAAVSHITMVSGTTWYQIDPAKGSATWTDELTVTDNGGKYRVHTINFNVIGEYNSLMADALDALSLGKYMAIVKRSDNTYVLLARVSGLESSAAIGGGSSDESVVNGIQITLTANAAETALPLLDSAIDDLMAYINGDEPVQRTFSGQLQIGIVDDSTGALPITYDGPETGYRMTVTVDGQSVTWSDGQITLPEDGADINVEATVTKSGYVPLTASKTVSWFDVNSDEPIQRTFSGQLQIGSVDASTGALPITYDGTETGYQMAVTVDDEPVTWSDGSITLPNTGDSINVEATMTKSGYTPLTASKTVSWAGINSDEPVPGEFSISGPDNNGDVFVTLTGAPAGVVVTATVDGNSVTVAEQNNGYVVNLGTTGDHVLQMTASLSGYQDLVQPFRVTWRE